MKLDSLPRVHLAEFPTPVHYLETLTKAYKGPAIYMKRDDLTSLGMGGNKTRKLEFLIGEALKQGADTLVTTGGIQSNHCRLTAAAARKAGFDCHLVLNGTPPKIPNGNLLLDIILGAKVHYCDRKDRDKRLFQVSDQLSEAGKNPYVIPVGGSNSIGSVGYVNAMLELNSQLDDMGVTLDAIIFATSSGGTQAGLTLGAKITGFKGDVLGISIDQTKIGSNPFPPVLTQIANATAERIGSDIRITESDCSLNCDYLGAGYAVPGELEFNAIKDLCLYEGILLGPVYTARAMGGFLDLIKKGCFTKHHTVLFWHTGGTPELFAWADQLREVFK
ncbi:MAG: D-cysteine desulfhydrase family protein [Proteobacteria bacterium]|nr:D-cysteine desulfhydrase family protein [Pseudomonadota bacterium]MBU2453401.1 D-cysteine desulfhydrase family protein [Pseudomonadota bacterium]MBU2628027.1 D-cysteine desulfhydrase family protein [Pseudomonadota bacterium]